MKKKIPCLLIALLAILLMGCGYSKEEKQQQKEYEEQGRKNALEYVKEKYGFDAEVQTTTNCFDYGNGLLPRFHPDPTGYVFVQMSYESNSFFVCVNGQKKDSKGYDDYQEKQITEDFTALFEKNADLKAERLDLDYGKYLSYDGSLRRYSAFKGLVSTYYDGSNLLEVIGENPDSACSALVVDEDLSQLDPDKLHTDYNLSRFIVVNFISDYGVFNNRYDSFFSTDAYSYDELALSAKGFLVSCNGDSFYNEFSVHEINEFKIVTYNGAPVTLEKTTMDDDSAFKGHGYYKNYGRITDAYTVKTDADFVLVFVNRDKIKKPDDEKDLSLGIQSVSSKTGDKSYSKQDFGRIYLDRSEDLRFAIFGEWKE